GPAGYVAHVQAQALAGIGLGHGDQVRADLGLDAELFVQLAHQGGLGRFARLALAAGKFPEAGEVAVGGAARQQDAAAGVGDDGGEDFDRVQLRPRPSWGPLLRELPLWQLLLWEPL